MDLSWLRPKSWLAVGRQVALGLALVGGAVVLGYVLHGHEPLQQWLAWRYVGYWLAMAAVSLACLCLGNLVVLAIMKRALPLLEHLIVSFALGLFAFEWLMFIAGVFQLFRPVLFFALPLVCILGGGRQLLRRLRRWRYHLTAARRRSHPRPVWTNVIVAFGALMLFAVYFVILTPENVQFDSRWKQMALAEELVAAGGLRRFAEGWTTSTRPCFTSYLYAWGFLLRDARLFDKMLLGAHVEFAVFAWTTLVGIPAAVRRLAPRADPALVWVARFLFPGILVYDSCLAGGSDHIGALFGIPILLVGLRAYRDLNPRYCLLLAACLSAGAMVKYTIVFMLVVPPVLVIAARAVYLGIRSLRGRAAADQRWWWLAGPGMAVAGCLVLTSAHWLKNTLLHGSPMYPALHGLFSGRPWTEDASYMYVWGYQEHQFWKPEWNLDGLIESLKVLVTFSFIPHDWKRFHRDIPVFGSLFTLLLVCVPLLRKNWRLWVVIGWVHAAVFLWFWTHHQDRYLQGVMPLMAVATATMVMMIWRAARAPVRVALAGLIALQVVWGADKLFYPSHAMVKSAPKEVIKLLSAAFRGDFEKRFEVQPEWVKLGKSLPKDAVVLLHDNHYHLGLDRRTVNDWSTWQFGLSYGLLGTPADVYRELRGLGVTHVHWEREKSRGYDSVAGDLLFFAFAQRHTVDRKRAVRGYVGRMPDHDPPEEFEDTVAMLSCRGRAYHPGLYRVSDLRVPVFGPESETYPKPRVAMSRREAKRMLQAASFAVLEGSCAGAARRELSGFERVAKRRPVRGGRSYELYVRTRGQGSGMPSG